MTALERLVGVGRSVFFSADWVDLELTQLPELTNISYEELVQGLEGVAVYEARLEALAKALDQELYKRDQEGNK